VYIKKDCHDDIMKTVDLCLVWPIVLVILDNHTINENFLKYKNSNEISTIAMFTLYYYSDFIYNLKYIYFIVDTFLLYKLHVLSYIVNLTIWFDIYNLLGNSRNIML
jgi:hypothetical protein